MLPFDKEYLKNMLLIYPPKEVMRELAGIALEVADEASDNGSKETAKELVLFSVALDDLITGRPFLV